MNVVATPHAGWQPGATQDHPASMLALVSDAFGGYGGIAQYNRDFLTACAMNSELSQITVLPRIAPDEVGILPPSVTQTDALRNRILYSARALRTALRMKPKVIFNGHIYHGPIALPLARLTGAKLVSQLHGTEVWNDIAPRHLHALQKSDLILTVSRDTRARAIAQLTLPPEKVVVVSNTVGESFVLGDRAQAREKFKLGSERTILTVARLDARDGYKGHDRIIRLMPRMIELESDVTYLIAGTGPDRLRLEALAKELGVDRKVRFLGMIPTEDLPDLYRAADLFALPSTGEGFGIAFLEAMACGTPAIGLAVGGGPGGLWGGEVGACGAPQDFSDALFVGL